MEYGESKDDGQAGGEEMRGGAGEDEHGDDEDGPDGSKRAGDGDGKDGHEAEVDGGDVDAKGDGQGGVEGAHEQFFIKQADTHHHQKRDKNHADYRCGRDFQDARIAYGYPRGTKRTLRWPTR